MAIFIVLKLKGSEAMIDLYQESGYINVPAIAARPTWLKVLIGARQVGKTYGTLKYYLESGEKFILLRRTTAELQFIGNNAQLDPFSKFAPEYHVRIQPSGGSYVIGDYNEDGTMENVRGVALSLPQISHIRGFDGSQFKAIIFDEAIPEKGVRVLKSEGDALLNAYTTISGNRELEGKPALQLWLLCNTNNINSGILEALNLTDDILYMRSRSLEYFERGGVSIFQGRSKKIIDKRKETALARQIAGGEFAGMAYDNEWSYDESPLIGQRSIKGMKPLCGFDDMFIWENEQSFYVCRVRHKTEVYKAGRYEKAEFIANYRWLVRWYAERQMIFSDLKMLSKFRQIFNIDY